MTAHWRQPLLIVAEPRPYWAPLLRHGVGDAVPLMQAGTLEQGWRELRQCPGSAVLAQVSPGNWPRLAEGVWLARERDPSALFLAALQPVPPEVHWVLRAVGLVHVLTTPLDVPAARRMLQRHFSHLPRPTLSLEEKIWNNLPWSQ